MPLAGGRSCKSHGHCLFSTVAACGGRWVEHIFLSVRVERDERLKVALGRGRLANGCFLASDWKSYFCFIPFIYERTHHSSSYASFSLFFLFSPILSSTAQFMLNHKMKGDDLYTWFGNPNILNSKSPSSQTPIHTPQPNWPQGFLSFMLGDINFCGPVHHSSPQGGYQFSPQANYQAGYSLIPIFPKFSPQVRASLPLW